MSLGNSIGLFLLMTDIIFYGELPVPVRGCQRCKFLVERGIIELINPRALDDNLS